MPDPRHKAYVMGWKATGAALAEIRKRELQVTCSGTSCLGRGVAGDALGFAV